MSTPTTAYAAILRLARRPQGVTISDVQTATGMTRNNASGRLAQYVKDGTLVRLIVKPRRFFITEEQAAQFQQGQQ